jgi:hypothetical protein
MEPAMTYVTWEAAWIVGALALGIAMAWGLFSYMNRDRSKDALTDRATREEYDNPASQDPNNPSRTDRPQV